jgi:putative ABC transport system permease protein
MMGSFWTDLRYGWRKLANSPGFTLVAILTLALGIGANTAIFSAVNAVLIRPLPYDEPERLVLVWNRMETTGYPKAPVAAPDIADYREQAKGFLGFAATNNVAESSLTGEGEPEQIQLASVTANYLEVLGVEPLLGRGFVESDEKPIPQKAFTDPTIPIPASALILSHDFWQRRFGGDPSVLGRAVQMDFQPMTVVGVMPSGFEVMMPVDAGMPTDIDAWTPLRLDLAQGNRESQNLRVVARLRPGVTVAQAQSEMDAIAARQRERHQFHQNMGMQIDVVPMHADVVGHVRPTLLALLGAVGFVLLIACANVANLILTRASARRREMAVRVALGAARGRLVQLVVVEGMLLAALGAVGGLLLARLGIDALLALRPPNLPRVDEIAINLPVLGFTLAATGLAAIFFGLAPLLDSRRASPRDALQARTGQASGLRARGALVIAEVALSVVLLIGAGLMLRSFAALQDVRPGFDAQDVLTYKISLPFSRYGGVEARTQFFQEMEPRVAALPGVEAVGGVFPLPLGGRFWTGPYGRDDEDPSLWTQNEANFRVITPGYFAAMGTRLLDGRSFERADISGRAHVVIIDAPFAEKVWPGESPVGKVLGIDLFGQRLFLDVVGVVEHMRHESLTADSRETLFIPHHLFPWTQMTVVARAGIGPESLVGAVSRQVAEMDGQLPVYRVRPLSAYVDDAMAATRFAMTLIAVFAAVALVLASVGLYGVIAFAVRQRTREIGIRMALGAGKESILRMVLGQGMIVILTGVGLGVLAAMWLTRVIASLLFGVSPTDPVTFSAIAGLLVIVALTACYLPARKAARVDPMATLRLE